jgi:hypothetical protein
MGRLRLFDRVKSWFGAKIESPEPSTRPAAKRWSLETAESGTNLTFSGASAGAVAARRTGIDASGAEGDAAFGYIASQSRDSDEPASRSSTSAVASPNGVTAGSGGDPLDPAWMSALDELPRRIADAASQGAAGVHALKSIAYELEGYRQNTRAMLQAMRRLPFLEAEQTEVARDANKLLERQLLILESTFDGITSLRASFRSVDEGARRQILAISQLETCHRNVLLEYQALLIRAHRRVAWIAAMGILLGAVALGSVAYVAWRVLVQ